jgi:hypothetical protein
MYGMHWTLIFIDFHNYNTNKQTAWLLVCKQAILTEQPPLVGEASADRGCRVVSAMDSNGR